jgi:serine/threonine protein kinase
VWNRFHYPKRVAAKIIDFGGATFADEHHSALINTRQYRAPEVILTSGKWNEKSDIWCLACVIIEMYTGQLYFATRNNDLQHLAMIEKVSGFIPKTMIQTCSEQMKYLFDTRKK